MKSSWVAVVSLGMIGSAFPQIRSADSAALRMQRVEDRQAIEQLLMGDYPRALDSGDWAAYAALFAKDGTLIMGGGATKAHRTGRDREVLQLAANPRSGSLGGSIAVPGSPGRAQNRARGEQPDPADRR